MWKWQVLYQRKIWSNNVAMRGKKVILGHNIFFFTSNSLALKLMILSITGRFLRATCTGPPTWSVLRAFTEPSARTTLHALLKYEEQDGGGCAKFARPAGESQGKLKERGRKYSKTNRQRSERIKVLLKWCVLISSLSFGGKNPGPVSKLRLRLTLARKLNNRMCLISGVNTTTYTLISLYVCAVISHRYVTLYHPGRHK